MVNKLEKMKFERISPWIFPIVSLFVVVISLVAIVYPWGKDAWQKKQEVEVEEKRLSEKLSSKLDLLMQINEKETKSNLDKVDLILPSFPQVPLLMQVLEEVASKSEIKIKSMQFKQVSEPTVEEQEKGENQELVKLELSIFADWAQTSAFLKKLEKVGRVVKIETFKLVSSQKEGEEGYWVTLSLDAPYQSIPEDLGPIDEPLEAFTAKDSEMLSRIGDLEIYTLTPEEIEKIPVGKENLF